MRRSVLALNLVPPTLCASSSVNAVAQVVLNADGAPEAEIGNALLRKEPQQSLIQEAALQNLTQQQPAASFNSSSGLWKEIRKRAKVTAVEPFSADGPPAVVYTGQTASAAATILMGTTTCFAAVAWTTQSTLKHVKEASWQTLSPAIAIFSAVQLLYILREMTNLLVSDNMATEEVSLKGLRQEDTPSAVASGGGAVLVAFARLILGYAALQLTFFLSRQRKLAMSIAVQFGSQLVGLLSADAFATWQEMPFWNTVAMSFGLVCITVLVLAVLLPLAGQLRSKVIGDEQQKECFQSDARIASLAISLPFAQFWRFLLAGQLPHYLGVQRSGYNRSETLLLFVVWVTILLLAVGSDKLVTRLQGPLPEGAGRIRSILHKCMSAGSCVPLTLAYTSAWCCFYWAKWATYSLMVGDAVVTAGYFLKAEMYVAMLFSVLGLATTYAILHAQEKWPQISASAKLISEANVFVLPLCWSSTFQSACAFSKDTSASEALQVLDRCLQCQWMCVVLIPVWLLLILPKTTSEKPSDEGDGQKQSAEGEGQDKAGEVKAPAADAKSGDASAEKRPAPPPAAEQDKKVEGSQPAAGDDDQY